MLNPSKSGSTCSMNNIMSRYCNLKIADGIASPGPVSARPIAVSHSRRTAFYHSTAGFVLHTAVILLMMASAVAGFLLYAAYNHGNTVRRWHDYDQCLLDAQSALEQVKYEMIQAYGSNGQSSATWFLSWSSNAIGAAPRYYIPSPLVVNATPVWVTLAGVTILTNMGINSISLSLVADAKKGDNRPIRRKIQEQMRMSVGGTSTPIRANSALGIFGASNTWNIGGKLIVDGHDWSLPATFNVGNGSRNSPSTNDMPGLIYDSAKTVISSNSTSSIDGNPPGTNATGAYNDVYWNQFLNTVTPAATLYSGGSHDFGTRASPVITIFPDGATTVASVRSGAGIIIIPAGAMVRFNQDFYYEGLVIFGSSGASQNVSVTVSRTMSIYGAMIGLGNAGALDVIISGTLRVLYSKESVDNLANLPNLSPTLAGGGSSNGMPYTFQWREIR